MITRWTALRRHDIGFGERDIRYGRTVLANAVFMEFYIIKIKPTEFWVFLLFFLFDVVRSKITSCSDVPSSDMHDSVHGLSNGLNS